MNGLAIPFSSEHELLRFLEEQFPVRPTRVLTMVTGLTEKQINNLAYPRGWKKSGEYKSIQMKRQAENMTELGKSYRFKKGHTPANKGKKMPPEVYAKLAPNMFKKGQTPHNAKYDGAITKRRDGSGREYAYIRLRENVWEPYHRVIWEQEHGTIPDGHVVAFKDGNTGNCCLDNLELIPMAENMQRNSINRYPEDVAKAIRLVGALNREIKTMEDRW